MPSNALFDLKREIAHIREADDPGHNSEWDLTSLGKGHRTSQEQRHGADRPGHDAIAWRFGRPPHKHEPYSAKESGDKQEPKNATLDQ